MIHRRGGVDEGTWRNIQPGVPVSECLAKWAAPTWFHAGPESHSGFVGLESPSAILGFLAISRGSSAYSTKLHSVEMRRISGTVRARLLSRSSVHTR